MQFPLHQIPRPLVSGDFVRASHFQTGFDQKPESSTVLSPYRTEYPPRWGSYRREPILPPKCCGVLNQDMDNSWDRCSETIMSYPAWPLEPRPMIHPPASCFQMHADPHHRIITSITRESYPYPSTTPHVTLNRVDKWDDYVPCGDKEKQPLPDSLYQQSYPAYQEVLRVTKAPSQHLGGIPAVRGDGGNYYNTTYQSEFTGEWVPPVKSCSENRVSIVFGDPRYVHRVSEQKRAYTVQKSEGQCYHPVITSAMVHQLNVRPGDGQHRFSTIMSESYLWNQPEPAHRSGQRKNDSNIILGDLDERRKSINMTSNQFYYHKPNAKELVNQRVSPPQTKVHLGDSHMLPSFNTSHNLEYQPPPEIQKVDFQKRALIDSDICLNYKGPGAPDFTTLSTTTKDMLVPYKRRKHQLTEEELQKLQYTYYYNYRLVISLSEGKCTKSAGDQILLSLTIKYSHLIHPWKQQRWFSTEQKDAYTEKYKGPITLATSDFQISSVPLGTMVKYQPRKKFAS